MWTVKLCRNKVTQFLTGVPANTGDLTNNRKTCDIDTHTVFIRNSVFSQPAKKNSACATYTQG